MGILLANLCIVFISSILARCSLKTKTIEDNPRRYNYFFIMIIILSLTLVSGFRKAGTDYYTYRYMFLTQGSPNFLISEDSTEMGFTILCKILYKISNDPQIFFVVTSLIISVCMVMALKKYSKIFELSVYLYVTTFMYYASMNILRQWIATAIMFLGFRFLYERKWYIYFPIVIFSSAFHSSAIVMILIYFIVNHKIISVQNLVKCIILGGCFLLYNQSIGIFFNFLETTKYANYMDEFVKDGNGVNILRVLVYLAPVLLVALMCKKLNLSVNIKNNIIFNLCLIGFLIMLLGAKHAYFARMCVYFEPYYLLLIPNLVLMFKGKERKIVYYIIMILYFLFSTLLLIRGESNIYPFRLINMENFFYN